MAYAMKPYQQVDDLSANNQLSIINNHWKRSSRPERRDLLEYHLLFYIFFVALLLVSVYLVPKGVIHRGA